MAFNEIENNVIMTLGTFVSGMARSVQGRESLSLVSLMRGPLVAHRAA